MKLVDGNLVLDTLPKSWFFYLTAIILNGLVFKTKYLITAVSNETNEKSFGQPQLNLEWDMLLLMTVPFTWSLGLSNPLFRLNLTLFSDIHQVGI